MQQAAEPAQGEQRAPNPARYRRHATLVLAFAAVCMAGVVSWNSRALANADAQAEAADNLAKKAQSKDELKETCGVDACCS